MADTWSHFIVPLVSSPSWRVGTASSAPPGGPVATPAQMQQVLAGLTALRIQADQHAGEDRTDLDNVALVTTVPEPAPLGMLGTALALALLRAGRLRRARR